MKKNNFLQDLLVPNLDELKSIIQSDLQISFEHVNCEIVDCPDFSKEPFFLSGKGICGQPVIVDIGGFANLLPMPNYDAQFDLTEAVENCNIGKEVFVLGAGGGPFHEVGANCEIVVDAKFENSKLQNNKSIIAKVHENENISFTAASSKFALLGQFLCCKGLAGKVLKVTAEKRKLDGSLVCFIQSILERHYGSEKLPVGLGGVVFIHTGDVKIHVMPKFSECPLENPKKVAEWLKFFQVSAPFVAVGQMVSHDPLNLDLRLEHFHGFTTDRKQAGHFHYDVTPDKVKYSAYFVIGEKLLRLHQPHKN